MHCCQLEARGPGGRLPLCTPSSAMTARQGRPPSHTKAPWEAVSQVSSVLPLGVIPSGVTSFSPGPGNGVRGNRYPPRRGSLGREGGSSCAGALGRGGGRGVAPVGRVGPWLWDVAAVCPRSWDTRCVLLPGHSALLLRRPAPWPQQRNFSLWSPVAQGSWTPGRGPERPSSGCPGAHGQS